MANHQATTSITATHTTLRVRSVLAICAATAVAGSVLALTIAAPIAHADGALDPIRAAVNGARSGTTCPALGYNGALEGLAQAAARNEAIPSGYPGKFQSFLGSGDPEQQAIDRMMFSAGDAIRDCTWKDFGVGFVRFVNQHDNVTVVLGAPAPPPPPPPPAAPPPPPPPPAAPPPTPLAKISGDVDLYDIPGGSGHIIGRVTKGTGVQVLERRADNWVHISFHVMTHGVDGWVWGDYVPATP